LLEFNKTKNLTKFWGAKNSETQKLQGPVRLAP